MPSRATPGSDAQRLTYASVAPETRSRMQAVRGRDTEPELRVRRALHGMGCRFRLQRKDLPGTPDIVLPRHRKVVLVHGCFWHGHDCRNTRPAEHQEYWQKKRERNMKHDKEVTAMFEARGWTVLRIWECELKKKNESTLVDRLKSFI